MEIVYFIIAIGACALLVLYVVRKLRHGASCCGEHESAPERVRPKDRNISNYPYRYTLGIEGMVCANCLRRVENALNGSEGIYAKGSLERKSVKVYSKSPLTRKAAVQLLAGTSYTISGFREESEEI